MGSRSSLHEDFVRVKTLMGLERFEVEKNCPTNVDSTPTKMLKSAGNRVACSWYVGNHR